jgi:putative Flp pilus-assembly TadE/G-like protein
MWREPFRTPDPWVALFHRAPGQVVVLMALSLLALLGFAGLATDVGYFRLQQRMAQTAADSAAKAGVENISGGEYTTAAQNDAALNGFTDGSDGVTVTVSKPPTSGSYSGDPNAVAVIVSKAQPTFFLWSLGFKTVTISATAVAKLASGGCVIALNKTKSNALVASGSASVSAQCAVEVDSSSSNAVVTSGSACITGTSIDIVGNYSNSSSCGPSPKPTTGIASFSDPLSSLAAPTYGTCNHTNFSISSSQTLDPGVYCNGITIKNLGTTATLNAGTYILLGGGFNVSGGASVTGSSVFFYNTGNATYAYKPVVISGGSGVTLSAPTTGTYAGILFFQDRSISSSSQNTISGASTAKIEGTLYFPTTPLTYSGGSSSSGAAYTVLIADTITFSGSSYIGDDYTSLPYGSPVAGTSGVLAE